MSRRRIVLEKKLRRNVHFHFFSSVTWEKLFNDDTLYLLVCHGSVSFGQIGLDWIRLGFFLLLGSIYHNTVILVVKIKSIKS